MRIQNRRFFLAFPKLEFWLTGWLFLDSSFVANFRDVVSIRWTCRNGHPANKDSKSWKIYLPFQRKSTREASQQSHPIGNAVHSSKLNSKQSSQWSLYLEAQVEARSKLLVELQGLKKYRIVFNSFSKLKSIFLQLQFLELFLTNEFATSITLMIISISIFNFIQGNILHGHVFAMKLSLEHLSLAAFTQLRDQFWFKISSHSQKPESKTNFTICRHSCFDCQHLASRRSQNTKMRSRGIFPIYTLP